MSADRAVETTLVAFMRDPDAPRPENPIHSTGGARDYGYRGALVGGVTVYGWAVPAILQALGNRWLEDGFAEVALRHPTYPGDRITTRVEPRSDGSWDLGIRKQDDELAVSGSVGLGRAPWFEMFHLPKRCDPEARPDSLMPLALESAPVGRDVRAMAVAIDADEARAFAREYGADDNPLFTRDDPPLLHPGWVAGAVTRLLHHSYEYGPAIHSRSHIQHLRRAEAGQTLTVAGHMVRAYERKGHHYHETDGVLLAEDGSELARLRHTGIFRVRRPR